MGFGAGFFRCTSRVVPIVCGVLALAIGLFTEWRFAPLADDNSLKYFLGHVYQLKPITLIMIAAGALLGFWIPFRRIKSVKVDGVDGQKL